MSPVKRKSVWRASWKIFPRDVLAYTIEILLVGLLLFAPLAFGSVEPWSELVVVTVSSMIAACVAMRMLIRGERRLVRSWAFLPLVLFICLAVFQLLPLPAKLISLLSPATVQTRGRFLSDLSQPGSFPLSLYPHATRHDLRIVLAASAIFFAVVNYYRRPEQIKRLLGCVTIIGAAVAVLALAQDLSGATNIYFIGPHGRGSANAGPFVHYSHFSQFMNLCVGTAISLLLLALFSKFRRTGFNVAELPGRWQDATLHPIWWCAAIVSLGVTTIFMSGSRGGMIATFIGFGLLALVMSLNSALPGRGWLILPLVLMAFGIMSFFGFNAALNRLSTLQNQDQTGGRLQMLHDLTHEWKKFPLLGTGLGTHDVVFPQFETSTALERYTHAEDEYAQMIEETGFIGLALVLSFIAILFANIIAVLRTGDPRAQLIISGLGYGLIAVAAHSLTDFGQHVPAVACLTAVVCGLIVSVARVPTKHESSESSERSPAPETKINWLDRLGIGGIATGITAVAVWAVLGAGQSFAAASELKLAQTSVEILASNQWRGFPDDFDNLMTHAAAAVNSDPGDVQHRCTVDSYRWQLEEVRLSAGGADSSVLAAKDCRDILADLNTARLDCPVYGPAYLLTGQIESEISAEGPADKHLSQAFELSQADPVACLLAATGDAKAGRWDASKTKFRRFLSMSCGSFDTVIDVYVRQLHRPDLALELAQDDIGRLQNLAGALRQSGDTTALADRIDRHVFDLLKQRCSRPDAPPDVLVQFAAQAQQHHDAPMAIQCYRRAIALNYAQVDWHLALAQLLADSSQVPAAMHEAQICLWLRPEMPEAKKMLGDLSLLPAGQAD